MTEQLLAYKVGALMYVPALNKNVGEKICNGHFKDLDSLAFCLEDSIQDDAVLLAEKQLVDTLTHIQKNAPKNMPMLFVRVRNCNQFDKLSSMLLDKLDLLTGIIFPKFDLQNAAEYCSLTGKINCGRKKPLKIMPILESESILNLETRKRTLIDLRKLLDGYKDYILNIRVGAMDFCKHHGLRRNINQSIYDIGIVRDVLIDILNVFSDSYVVSAPVWEYFDAGNSEDAWAKGLENELSLDLTNGFIGKTVIHPSQIPIVKKYLKPSLVDYKDALSILDWTHANLGVAKNTNGNRMNELATHYKWATKIINLAEAHGVLEL